MKGLEVLGVFGGVFYFLFHFLEFTVRDWSFWCFGGVFGFVKILVFFAKGLWHGDYAFLFTRMLKRVVFRNCDWQLLDVGTRVKGGCLVISCEFVQWRVSFKGHRRVA